MTEQKDILEKLFWLKDKERYQFLKETFAGANWIDFSGFLGFVKSALVSSKESAGAVAEVMTDLALIAMSVGRKDGFEYAAKG